MALAYLFAVLAMLSIGVLGILSKLADRLGCTPLNTTLVLFGGSAVFMGFYVGLIQRASLIPPAFVTGTALAFGAIAVLAFWVFLFGLQFGKITSSWIFMNLSAVVPAALFAADRGDVQGDGYPVSGRRQHLVDGGNGGLCDGP